MQPFNMFCFVTQSAFVFEILRMCFRERWITPLKKVEIKFQHILTRGKGRGKPLVESKKAWLFFVDDCEIGFLAFAETKRMKNWTTLEHLISKRRACEEEMISTFSFQIFSALISSGFCFSYNMLLQTALWWKLRQATIFIHLELSANFSIGCNNCSNDVFQNATYWNDAVKSSGNETSMNYSLFS